MFKAWLCDKTSVVKDDITYGKYTPGVRNGLPKVACVDRRVVLGRSLLHKPSQASGRGCGAIVQAGERLRALENAGVDSGNLG
jgi:hypothetical protein